MDASISLRIRFIIAKRKEERLRLIRRRRELRDCSNPFDIPDEKFQKLFRFPKYLARYFIQELSVFMDQRQKIHGLPCFLRILIALQFYATGSYQRIVGDGFILAVSQASVSRCIREVSKAINDHLLDKYVVFPATSEQFKEKNLRFDQEYGFAGVIGCIDGTHILIKKPDKNIEHVYVYRKGIYSKNIQIICDCDLLIMSVNPKFGGTADDAFIWKSSLLQQHLEQLYRNGEREFWLLGDNGYPQQPWLMTPILNPTNEKEDHYNVVHKLARNCIQRCIKMLKGRFRCLSKAKFLSYSPSECGVIINACSVLHNIFVRNTIDINESNIDTDEDEPEDAEYLDDTEYTIQSFQHLTEGLSVRDRLVEENF